MVKKMSVQLGSAKFDVKKEISFTSQSVFH